MVAETEARWSDETARLLRELAKPVADAAENNSTFMLLTAIPATHKLTLTNMQMQTYIRRRLCITIPICATLLGKQCQCGADFDPYGDHLLSCKKGKERHIRHNAVVNAFAHILHKVGIHATLEQKLTQFGIVEDKPGQKMDLVYLDTQGSMNA